MTVETITGLNDDIASIHQLLGERSVVLVGMMGCGKSSVGRRLAQRLGLGFVDADTEIETAATMTVAEIFATRGEAEFRDGEKRVIARLLSGRRHVLATGGGAYLNAETRARIREKGICLWLKVDFEVLMRRVRKRASRPLLQTSDPEATMRRLLSEREPIYALADVTIPSHDDTHEVAVETTLRLLAAHLRSERAP